MIKLHCLLKNNIILEIVSLVLNIQMHHSQSALAQLLKVLELKKSNHWYGAIYEVKNSNFDGSDPVVYLDQRLGAAHSKRWSK